MWVLTVRLLLHPDHSEAPRAQRRGRRRESGVFQPPAGRQPRAGQHRVRRARTRGRVCSHQRTLLRSVHTNVPFSGLFTPTYPSQVFHTNVPSQVCSHQRTLLRSVRTNVPFSGLFIPTYPSQLKLITFEGDLSHSSFPFQLNLIHECLG
jgi:hypothetical protein